MHMVSAETMAAAAGVTACSSLSRSIPCQGVYARGTVVHPYWFTHTAQNLCAYWCKNRIEVKKKKIEIAYPTKNYGNKANDDDDVKAAPEYTLY